MTHYLYAGYAQRIITPSLSAPVYLVGFNANRRADDLLCGRAEQGKHPPRSE